MDLDALDPLDPLKPPSPRSDEAARRAVAVGERLPADMSGKQQGVRVAEAEAPAVTGARDHAHVASAGLDAGHAEQPLHRTLKVPRRQRPSAERGRNEELAPTSEVAPAGAFGPHPCVSE